MQKITDDGGNAALARTRDAIAAALDATVDVAATRYGQQA